MYVFQNSSLIIMVMNERCDVNELMNNASGYHQNSNVPAASIRADVTTADNHDDNPVWPITWDVGAIFRDAR
jgi:hypothetical protein